MDDDYESDGSDSGESWGELERKAAREDKEAHNRVILLAFFKHECFLQLI